jgi:drug/metabolite transporter (DMT)-like permease
VTTFVVLCLLSRLGYALNDVLTGRLARAHGPIEVATWRGLTLGVTMAPLLFFVQEGAWEAMAARWEQLLVLAAVTALVNLFVQGSARHLPFGVRAAFLISTTAVASVVLGGVFLGERLAPLQLVFAAVLVGAAVAAAPGAHATHEIRPRLVLGGVMAVTGGVLLAAVAVLGAKLARETDPFLTAWAWEFGAGLLLVPLLAVRVAKDGLRPGLAGRVWRIAVASSPTIVGSGATMLALQRGDVGLWASIGGTHILFSVALGRLWHAEPLGPRRIACFAVAAVAVAALALVGMRGG